MINCAGDFTLAQDPRNELGHRLRRFEHQFEMDHTLPKRKACAKPMQEAVSSFFRLQLLNSARKLDEAYVSLLPKEKQATAKQLVGLQISGLPRLIDAEQKTVSFKINRFYEEKTHSDNLKRTLHVGVYDSKRAKLLDRAFTIDSLPKQIEIELSQTGDFQFEFSAEIDDTVVPISKLIVSRIEKAKARLSQVEEFAKNQESRNSATETIKLLAGLGKRLADGKVLETEYPVSEMLEFSEKLRGSMERGETWLNPANAGFGLLKLRTDKRQAVVRVQFPDQAIQKGDKVPCVFALHGAGGSENLFMDGYGDGKIRRLCRDRGWALIAPRIGFGGLRLSLDEIMDAIDVDGVIDRNQVLIVGHSMGVSAAIREINRYETSFAGAALIGGGARSRLSDESIETHFFVSAGELDFGRPGAAALHRSLTRSKLKSEYREYKQIEHMAIVQISLDDVFDFFDGLITK